MPFEPGQSGNPSGSKTHKDWTAAIKRALARRGEGDYFAGLNKLADKLLDKAEESDLGALKELGDRIEGKPVTIIGGDEDRPLKHDLSLEVIGVRAGE